MVITKQRSKANSGRGTSMDRLHQLFDNIKIIISETINANCVRPKKETRSRPFTNKTAMSSLISGILLFIVHKHST